MIDKAIEPGRIAHLFAGWEETLIWSCLQGCMGYAVADDPHNPTAAFIVIGDFCFFAGTPSLVLVQQAPALCLVPRDAGWEKAIEAVWGDRATKQLRYAIKKEPEGFDVQRLTAFVDGLGAAYTLQLFDRALYEQAGQEEWSKDLRGHLADYADFSKRGLGVAALHQGRLVAGASSYTVYRGGIEIEIDTKPEYQGRGLATACGAKLILECLGRGLYPSWDAYDLRSVALAEKLGYHMDRPYTTYNLQQQ